MPLRLAAAGPELTLALALPCPLLPLFTVTSALPVPGMGRACESRFKLRARGVSGASESGCEAASRAE